MLLEIEVGPLYSVYLELLLMGPEAARRLFLEYLSDGEIFAAMAEEIREMPAKCQECPKGPLKHLKDHEVIAQEELELLGRVANLN